MIDSTANLPVRLYCKHVDLKGFLAQPDRQCSWLHL